MEKLQCFAALPTCSTAVTPGHTQLNGFAEVWILLLPVKLLLSIAGALLALRTDHVGWQTAAEILGCCRRLRDSYFTTLEKEVITDLNSQSRIYRLRQETGNFTCKTHSRMTCSTYLIDSNCLFWFSVNHKFMSYNFICFPCAAVCHSRRKHSP